MARYSSRENEPLGKWKEIPIYLTTILTALLVLGLVGTAILMSLRTPLLYNLMFILPGGPSNFIGAITYPFIDRISFFSIFGIMFFYWLMVGIESHFGRTIALRLFAILILVPVALALVFWYGFGSGSQLQGNYYLSVGLVIAFATVYPRAEFWGWIPFKYVAFFALACASLMQVADRSWIGLTATWGVAAAAFLYMRQSEEAEYDDYIPLTARIRAFFRPKPKLRVVPKPTPSGRTVPSVSSVVEEGDAEVDALLDKIAKTGLSSLSNSERAKLERARQALLKKEQH